MKLQSITQDNFEKEVLDYKGNVCVKFYATWCGPCRMLSQVMHEIDDVKYDALKVVEVDVDNAPKLSRQLGIMSVPTMAFYTDGALVETVVGFKPEAQLKELFDKYI